MEYLKIKIELIIESRALPNDTVLSGTCTRGRCVLGASEQFYKSFFREFPVNCLMALAMPQGDNNPLRSQRRKTFFLMVVTPRKHSKMLDDKDHGIFKAKYNGWVHECFFMNRQN